MKYKGNIPKDFKIYGRKRDGLKTGRGWVYETSEGDMLTATLADFLGLTVPGFNVRTRTYGVTDPRVIHGGTRGGNFGNQKGKSGGGNAEWRKLSDKPRTAPQSFNGPCMD